ncbi:MAG: hypothetical protein WDN31_00255 [Hyphomicrobium sp.]
MIRDEHIDLGVAQGIISSAQAVQLRALAASAPAPATSLPAETDALDPDDERFRLIGGFNDVFVSIGVLLLVSALFGLTSTLGFGAGFALIAMAAAWALSEVFARRLRLALPAIALSLMFAAAAGIATYMLVAASLQAAGPVKSRDADAELDAVRPRRRPGGGRAPVAIWRAHRHGDHRRRARVRPSSAASRSSIRSGPRTIARFSWRALEASSLPWQSPSMRPTPSAARADPTSRSGCIFWRRPCWCRQVSALLIGPAGDLGVAQAIGICSCSPSSGLSLSSWIAARSWCPGFPYAGLAIGYLLSESLSKDISVSLTLLGWRLLCCCSRPNGEACAARHCVCCRLQASGNSSRPLPDPGQTSQIPMSTPTLRAICQAPQ